MMTATGRPTIHASRIQWMDNLRTFMVLMVVLIHACGVYESSGAWASFWIVDDPATNDLAGIVFLILDLFTMPVLFFIAGYLTPASVSDRGGWHYLKTRFRRLMIPWLVAVLTLIPLYKVIFLHARGLPQESWATYFHWSNGIWDQNWLWFLPVLFLFSALYLPIRQAARRIRRVSVRTAILVAFLVAYLSCVAIDVFGLSGWTKTFLLDFQNERLLIYLLGFLLGAKFYDADVFIQRGSHSMLYLFVNAVAWLPVTCYLLFLLYPWFRPGQFIVSESIDRAILWFSYLTSVSCLMYLTIETFRRFQDNSGRLRAELNRNSYAVYIIHVIVMGALALVLLDTTIPSLSKLCLLTVATFAVSNAIVSLVRAVWRPFRDLSHPGSLQRRSVAGPEL